MQNYRTPLFIFIFCNSIFFVNCNGSTNTSDNFLFGLSERYDRFLTAVTGEESSSSTTSSESSSSTSSTDSSTIVVPSCSTDITVTTKTISLSEDGDVDAVFSSSADNGLTETDTDGGYKLGLSFV